MDAVCVPLGNEVHTYMHELYVSPTVRNPETVEEQMT